MARKGNLDGHQLELEITESLSHDADAASA